MSESKSFGVGIGVGMLLLLAILSFVVGMKTLWTSREADLYAYRDVSGNYQEYPEMREFIDKVYEDERLTQREYKQVLDARMKAAARRIIEERKSPKAVEGKVIRYEEDE